MRTTLFALALTAFALHCCAVPLVSTELVQSFAGQQVLRIHPSNDAEVGVLKSMNARFQLDWWKEITYPGRNADVRVQAGDLLSVKTVLKESGIQWRVMVEDIEKAMGNEQFSAQDDDWFAAYHTVEDILAWLKDLAAKHPDLATLVKVGTSYEGRDIMAIKITGKSNGNLTDAAKPGVWLDGGLHAREWITTSVIQYVINTLLTSYGTDAEITKMVDAVEWTLLPVFNPDGYSYTWTKDRMWRKTRSPNKGLFSLCTGTDPNRNWAFHWGEAGTSSNPCSDSYEGASAFSEIEVKSVADYIQANKNINAYVNFHSYSQLWMGPWGYTSEKSKDFDAQETLAENMVAAIKAVHGTSFQPGPIATTIYPASGSSADWTYGVCNITYSYGVELRDTGSHGFVLPPSEIRPSGEEIMPAVLLLAKAAAGL
jgi:murein tripeptide amidase MpaA